MRDKLLAAGFKQIGFWFVFEHPRIEIRVYCQAEDRYILWHKIPFEKHVRVEVTDFAQIEKLLPT